MVEEVGSHRHHLSSLGQGVGIAEPGGDLTEAHPDGPAPERLFVELVQHGEGVALNLGLVAQQTHVQRLGDEQVPIARLPHPVQAGQHPHLLRPEPAHGGQLPQILLQALQVRGRTLPSSGTSHCSSSDSFEER